MSMTDYAIIHEGLYAFGVQGKAPSRFLSVRGFATELGCCGVDRRTTGERGCGRIDTAQFVWGPRGHGTRPGATDRRCCPRC